MDEIVGLYPDLTRSCGVRKMRQQLLPALSEIVRGSPPRYGPLQSERYAFDVRMSQIRATDAEGLARVRELRLELENEIVARLQEAPPGPRRTLVLVMAKLDEYLGDRPLHGVQVPLRALLARLRRESDRTTSLRPAVRLLSALCRTILPARQVRRAGLKGMLAGHVDLYRTTSRPSVRMSAKNRLFALRPSEVTSLAGHVPARPVMVGGVPRWRHVIVSGSPMPPPSIERYSPLLDKLIGRDALSDFEFLSPSRRS